MLESIAWLPFHDIEGLIRWGGLVALIAIVFAETGLMIGFFLPGDSLLFTAGLLAASGFFNIWTLLIALILAAVIGDQVGFFTGRWMGHKLFNRPDSKVFRKEYVTKTHAFYEKYGAKTIVIARFVPIVRTFAPIVAGVGEMEYHHFIIYNVVGGIGWVALMLGLGFWLGEIPWVSAHYEYVTLAIIVLSLVPVALEVWKARRKKQ